MACGEAAMLSKCIDFVQNIVKMQQDFSVTVHIGTAFKFNFSNCKIETQNVQKKISPSKKRRNEARRIKFEQEQEHYNQIEKLSAVEEAKVEVVNSETQTDVDEPELSEFRCELCKFTSSWSNGLAFHVSSAHKVHRKLKCEDEVFRLTQQYWKTGVLESDIQVYINALMDVEEAAVDENVKEEEEKKLEDLWNESKNTSP